MRESRSAVRPAAAVVVLLPIIVVGAIHLGAILLALPGVVEWTKPLLMPALVIGLIWGAPERRSPTVALGVLALLLSWLGDVTLRWFVVGLIFFLLAHIVYLVLFTARLAERRVPWWAAAYAVWLVVLLTLLSPHTGPLLIPVVAYGIVLTAMAVAASRCNRWVAWGGALFVVSDSLLAMNRFLPDAGVPAPDFLIMLTYIAAQSFIVWGLLRHERARVALAPAGASAGAVGRQNCRFGRHTKSPSPGRMTLARLSRGCLPCELGCSSRPNTGEIDAGIRPAGTRIRWHPGCVLKTSWSSAKRSK